MELRGVLLAVTKLGEAGLDVTGLAVGSGLSQSVAAGGGVRRLSPQRAWR